MPIINTSYVRDPNRCWGPVMVPGEVYAFYINLTVPCSDPNFAGFRLDLMRASGAVAVLGVGVLEQDFIAPGNFLYNILCQFEFPVGTAPGQYKLRIFDTIAGVQKAETNTIESVALADAPNTAFVAFRHTYNQYGYQWEQNATFYIKFRLALIQRKMQIESERKQYRNVTDRRLRNLKSYMDEVIEIESYYFGEEGHKAIATMYQHDEIYMDNTFVVPKTAYTIEDDIRRKNTKGDITVIVDESVVVPSGATSPRTVLVDQLGDPVWSAPEDDVIFVTA